MTPALKAMVEAMAAELGRQVRDGEVDTTVAEDQTGPPTWVSLEGINLEKVARAGLEANGGVVDALRFYADQTNWASPSTGFVAQYDPGPSPFAKDRGARARAILDAILKDQP